MSLLGKAGTADIQDSSGDVHEVKQRAQHRPGSAFQPVSLLLQDPLMYCW
ncbi:hypothetical protein [Rufibacter quisquiliarum]|uniref:Uncharacterized protein n=1 Tax=Rufibacter quisquiliarum TaxID=1549639 RepID=A0A839GNP7_9BACT|nr:hypothetical protein [Rufibacter quisquiliarum]MBA9077165.1 hypothetical protein [Rufibacter quisquiliarum]